MFSYSETMHKYMHDCMSIYNIFPFVPMLMYTYIDLFPENCLFHDFGGLAFKWDKKAVYANNT